jgi:eukaryotic-like serine/threonine-protein kinase
MDDFTDRSQFRIGDLLVIPCRLIVVRDGQEIKFEPRWMEVLVMLAEHAGETLSTERLLIEVWGSTVYGDSPVSKTISYIRKSISDDSRKPRYVETVSKVGYRLIAPVSLPEDYRRMPSERWTEGSPYVGLSAFGADHASVFCGRSRIVADLLKAMRVQIENQRRFVLIVGASGCGKTSLLRAGAIPLLTKPDGFDGLRALSVTTCDLTANGSDPLVPLAAAVAAWTLGDRPVFPPQTPEQLKALLTDTPNMIEGFISEAFRRHSERDLAEQPYTHLLLTVDHAEALVATTDIDADARDAFARVLQALCACPHVVVTMITRGDFYLKLIEALPELAELKAGDGHLDVMAPRYGEIGEIIRSPAWKADLSFETDPETRTRLDDALRDAALSQPDALPLLQHTLQILYERRNSQQQLTFVAYNDIGGLEGAIAHRAEEVFATLPESEQKSLHAVLAKLIVILPDNDVVSARRAETDTFDSNARVLIDAFIKARLFVSDSHNGHRVFGVIHEALLRRWPRAVEWVQDNRRLLQAKARLERAAARWAEEGRRDDHLLNPGRPLAEAREAERCFADEITEDELSLLRTSERMSSRKVMVKRVAVGVLAILATVSTTLAIVATHANIAAERNRKEALDLMGYMLVELSDQLRPTASTRPMYSISMRALAFLEKGSSEDMSPDDLINYSRALRTRGEVLSLEGKDKQARFLFQRAGSISRQALQFRPKSTEVISEAGQAAYWLGYQAKIEGENIKAEMEWKRYLRYSEQLLQLKPHNPDWSMEFAFATANLGALDQARGNCADALEKFEPSIKLMDLAIRNKTSAPDSWVFNFIVARSWASRCRSESGNIRAAHSEYAQQISELRALLENRPDAIDWEQQLASLLHFNAIHSTYLGRMEEADLQIVEAVERMKVITKIQPNDPDWKRGLISAIMKSGEISYLQGDVNTAIKRTTDALRIIEKEPINQLGKDWKRLDSTIRFRLGIFRNDPTGNMMMDHAINDLFALATSNPENVHVLVSLSEALLKRGSHNQDYSQRELAINDFIRAKSTLDRFAKASANPYILAPWINARILLGERQEADSTIIALKKSGFMHPEFARIETDSL